MWKPLKCSLIPILAVIIIAGCAGQKVKPAPEADLETLISKSGLDIDLDENTKTDRAYGGWNIEPGEWVETFGAAATLADAVSGVAATPSHAHTGTYEPADATILKDADIGVSVEAYDATILKSGDIGNTVQAQTPSASQAEMEEGTESALRMVSPLRVKQAITANAGVGAGDLKADGTVPLTADWDAVKAITAKSYTVPKTSGVAGDFGLYEANSTDTDTAGFRGPSALGANTSYRLALPTAAPTSDNMTLTFSGTASTGSGTPANPLVHTGTYADLDNYASLAGDVSATEYGYLNGVTSSIQTQIDTKAPKVVIEVDGSAAITPLSTAQMSSTIIYNTGQTTADVTITAGTCAAGYNMLFTVGTAQAGNDWKFRAAANDKIYAIAADGTVTAGDNNGYFGFSAPAVGNAFACWSFKTDAYDWMCKCISGTCVTTAP